MERIRFFDFSVAVLKGRTVASVWATLLEALGHFGFDRALYVSTRFFSPEKPEIGDDALILTNHHQDMVDVFVGEELYRQTPTAAWGKAPQSAISWRTIEDRFSADNLTDAEKNMRALSRRLGVLAGYTLTLENADPQSRAVIGLCARPGLDQDAVDSIWMENADEISAMVNLAHLKLASLPHTGLKRPLTTRQRQVLRRVSDGATNQDIGDAMGLTVSGVEKILRQARGSLGVRTTAEAIKRATLYNLLSVTNGQS